MRHNQPTCERCRHFQFAFGETGFCDHPKLIVAGYRLTEALAYCPRWKPKGSKDGQKKFKESFYKG